MDNLLAQTALIFVVSYTVGDILGVSLFENVNFSMCATLSFAIYNNVHKILWERIRGLKC